MIRRAMIVTALLAFLGLAWMVGEWARMNFVPSPTPIQVPADAFVQHPGYEAVTSKAVEAFDAMPAGRQQELLGNLRENLARLDVALASLDQSRLTILCIGESHLDSTRRFVAGILLPRLTIDVLLLEASNDTLPGIMTKVKEGQGQVPLLGADIAAVIRSAREANSAVVIAGIDESESQKAQRVHRKQGSRDLSIAGNLRSQIRTGKRHLVLFGALHCADQPNWMYRRIRLGEHRVRREEITNINVIGEHQDGTVEAFLAFIDSVGVGRRNFLIADTGSLDRLIFTWFPGLTRSFLRFDAVIVFQEHAHRHSRAPP